jgi:hypothetical protein
MIRILLPAAMDARMVVLVVLVGLVVLVVLVLVLRQC